MRVKTASIKQKLLRQFTKNDCHNQKNTQKAHQAKRQRRKVPEDTQVHLESPNASSDRILLINK